MVKMYPSTDRLYKLQILLLSFFQDFMMMISAYFREKPRNIFS